MTGRARAPRTDPRLRHLSLVVRTASGDERVGAGDVVHVRARAPAAGEGPRLGAEIHARVRAAAPSGVMPMSTLPSAPSTRTVRWTWGCASSSC